MQWQLADGSLLTLIANVGDAPVPFTDDISDKVRVLYAHPAALVAEVAAHRLPPWSLRWTLRAARR